jgi:hypothetical protein
MFRKFPSIGTALRFAYPDFDWDLTKFSFRGKKSLQRWLRVKLEAMLLGVVIVEDYQHPELIWGR